MQTEDIENLSGRVSELTAELDIKKEMRNRASIGELTVVKKTPWRSTIKIVDDPQSPWKQPRHKFRRQALDYTILGTIFIPDMIKRMEKIGPQITSESSEPTLVGLRRWTQGLHGDLESSASGPVIL